MKKILVDTDVGNDIDDIFALTYLFSREDADILGATSVWGDPHARAACVDVIARAKGRNIPIYKGYEYNFDGTAKGKTYESYMAFERDNEHGDDFGKGDSDAIDFMYRTIKENAGEVTLIAIGPLTNVAHLFARYPDSARLLSELVIMGGAYFENPRCTWDIRAEWNFKCDAHGARIVFDAPVKKITVAGVDLTWDYQLPRLEAAKLFGDSPENAKQRAFAEKIYSGDPIWFHDPIACALAFDRSLGKFIRGEVEIELDGELSGKSTLIPKNDGKCFVCKSLTVSAEEFYKHYSDIIDT